MKYLSSLKVTAAIKKNVTLFYENGNTAKLIDYSNLTSKYLICLDNIIINMLICFELKL